MKRLADLSTDLSTRMFLREPPDDPYGFVFAMPSVAMSADNMRWEIIQDGSERNGWARMIYEPPGRRHVGEGPDTTAATLALLADMLGYEATIVDKIESGDVADDGHP
jgi:hypothetical protein